MTVWSKLWRCSNKYSVTLEWNLLSGQTVAAVGLYDGLSGGGGSLTNTGSVLVLVHPRWTAVQTLVPPLRVPALLVGRTHVPGALVDICVSGTRQC